MHPQSTDKRHDPSTGRFIPIAEAEYADRFWAHVYKTESCWLWAGPMFQSGYGSFGGRGYAHRIAYELLIGAIPDGLQLDHLCRVRMCVNPAHLEPVTGPENVRRGLKGILKTHCKQGHEYTAENTIRPARGGRQCRECKRVRDLVYKKLTRHPELCR